jgi:Sulfotransferase family
MNVAPFIVGAPRSGTTLLRLMLDAHPRLAIPPETAFIPALLARQSAGDLDADALCDQVAGSET